MRMVLLFLFLRFMYLITLEQRLAWLWFLLLKPNCLQAVNFTTKPEYNGYTLDQTIKSKWFSILLSFDIFFLFTKFPRGVRIKHLSRQINSVKVDVSSEEVDHVRYGCFHKTSQIVYCLCITATIWCSTSHLESSNTWTISNYAMEGCYTPRQAFIDCNLIIRLMCIVGAWMWTFTLNG